MRLEQTTQQRIARKLRTEFGRARRGLTPWRKFKLPQSRLEARDPVADCAALTARLEAYRDVEPASDPELIVPVGTSLSKPADSTIPEISARELNGKRLRAAITQHGALIVRDFFDRSSMTTLINCADRIIDNCMDPDSGDEIEANIYHNPPQNLRDLMPRGAWELGKTRHFHRESGSAMCIEAPSVAEALLELYEEYGLRDLLQNYLGERPCLSVKKWVLRRSRLPVAEAGWHQDGAFMGREINSLNLWMPLNECGGETGAPGMDLVPLRLNDIASAEGAQFNWSVSDSHVQGSFEGADLVAPVFNAGDAFFFDHFYLHRTQYRPDFSKIRYAVETWFFGESCFPKNQIPLAW